MPARCCAAARASTPTPARIIAAPAVPRAPARARTASARSRRAAPRLLRPSVRRLTNAEYDAAVQSLLGTTQTPSTNFPPDSRQAVNFTLNDGQRMDPVLAKALDDAAIALVAEARAANKFTTLAPCSNATTGGQACAQTFIKSFGAKAYRRALTDEEVTALTTLYTAGATGGAYNDGIDLVTRGLLQSAGFLYITQLGSGSSSPVTLTNDELASNLSFLVGGGPPDQTLLDAAAAGNLGNADGRETQVRRLLGTTPGKTRMVRVVREWLGTDAIAETGKDGAAYRGLRGRQERDHRREHELRRRGAAERNGDRQRAAERELERRRQHAGRRLRRHVGRYEQAHDAAEPAGHPEPGGVPVRLRSRQRERPGASWRRGHAPDRLHEPGVAGVAEHRRRAPAARPGEVDARALLDSLHRHQVRDLSRSTSTRSASRSSSSTGWGSSGRRTPTKRTRTSTSDERALASVNTTAATTIPSHGPQSTSRAPTPTATRWRWRWPAARGCASASRARCSGRQRAGAAPTCPTRPIGTPSTRQRRRSSTLEAAPEREPGEVRRDAGRLRP